MVRKSAVPKVRRGDVVFRVEWKKDQPAVVRYKVHSAAVSSMVITAADGREENLMGKESLQHFGLSADDAVLREFSHLTDRVSRSGANLKQALLQCGRLAALLK